MRKNVYFQIAHICFGVSLFMYGVSFDCTILKMFSSAMIFGIACGYLISGFYNND